jgi:hypothetical protein
MTTAPAETNLDGGVLVRFAHLHAAIQVHHHRALNVPPLLSLKCSALPVACPIILNPPRHYRYANSLLATKSHEGSQKPDVFFRAFLRLFVAMSVSVRERRVRDNAPYPGASSPAL